LKVQKVPQKDDGYIRFLCSSCGKRLKIKEHKAGGIVISCPRCRSSVVTPMSGADINAEESTSDAEESLTESLNTQTPQAQFHLPSSRGRIDAEVKSQLPGLSKHQGRWVADNVLPRVSDLDYMNTEIEKIETSILNKLQNIYRDENMNEVTRQEKTRQLAEQRGDKLGTLFKDTIKRARVRLMADESGLDDVGDIREQHERALEAVQVFAQLFYGLKI
jgi:DNA-directed RNA polymerase subunit RPC12/RpoP